MERLACWRVALGHEPADLIISGAQVADVHTGEIYAADVAVKGRRIAAVGDVAYACGNATTVYGAAGKYLTPGFIEGHIHATGCQLSPTELARVLLAHGTTVICTDLYEAAVVGGLPAMRQALDALNRTPLRTLFTVARQMYLQNERWGNTGTVSGDDLLTCYEWPECVGISEWLYHLAGREDPAIQALFRRLLSDRRPLVGHALAYSQRALQSYACLNAYSDHEATSAEEALDRLRLGYHVMIKHNHSIDFTEQILGLVTAGRADSRRLCFSTDHDTPNHLHAHGHLDEKVRRAIAAGVGPVAAVQMASLNCAEYFGIADDHGSIAPGKLADICVVDRLDETFPVSAVFAGGALVAEQYRYAGDPGTPAYPESWYRSVRFDGVITADQFRVQAPGAGNAAQVRVIGLPRPLSRTEARSATLPVSGGCVRPDVQQDILKAAVFERHHRSGRIGLGFVQGTGLRAGAVGSTRTPSMEVVVAGTTDEDMAAVANCIAEMGGGFAAARGGHIIGKVPLPLLGVMSAEPAEVLAAQFEELEQIVARELGAPRPVWRPLSFMSNPRSSPTLKLSCYGLLDVAPGSSEAVGLFLSQ